jgi:hypothetical protein
VAVKTEFGWSEHIGLAYVEPGARGPGAMARPEAVNEAFTAAREARALPNSERFTDFFKI